jgi:solute carrier family 25 (mitochondrial phosphate transporter), member 3
MVLPIPSVPGAVLLAPSPAHGEVTYDLMYYLKGAAAGGICCSVTHGALTPVDVVKTRVQLDPVKVRV